MVDDWSDDERAPCRALRTRPGSSPPHERLDLRVLAKELSEDALERCRWRPQSWPPERFIDYDYEPRFKAETTRE
jgi:hypothetical protein